MIKPGMFISDRYEVIDKVGSGGMADVYKAHDQKLNRNVAVKVLKQEFSTDESFVDKFRAEAQSAAGLSHPNIVNVYDVGEENGTYFIVMELIEGITLKSFIERKGRLEIREATGIAIQIAQGLEAAHSNNIIHRDIKPQNIIISKEGKVKVADFGIAKAASSNTLTSSAMGSVHYISPEQARGGYSDDKSDIYSLGITIYEMILGRVPFEGDNAVNIALLHIQEEPRTLGELIQGMPISVDKIVQKCLQKKAERRYNSVVELIDDLKRSLIEPNVDFVVIPDVLNNSPTIALSPDDVNAIRSGALQAELNSASNMMNANNGMNNMNGMQNGPQNMNYNNYPEYNNNDVAYESASISELERYDDNYEDEEEKVDNKLEKITIIGAVVIVILILGIIAFIISDNIGGKKKKEEDPQNPATSELKNNEVGEEFLPSVKDLSEEDARIALKNSGFDNVVVEYYDVANEEEGMVFNQDPVGGGDERVSLDTKITLYVKKAGSKKLDNEESKEIPATIKGKTYKEAEKIIKDLFDNDSGLKIELAEKEDTENSVEEGKVYQSSPEIGTLIKNTSRVVLFVNKKSGLVKVPNLIGKDKDQARQVLERVGLTLDEDIEYSEDNTSAQVDRIYDQNPARGSNVERGAKVKIFIRKEKEAPKKKDYTVVVTLRGAQATNPLKESVGEEPSVGNLTCKLTLNGVQYSAKEGGHSIEYSTFQSKDYTFTFEVSQYDGDLSTVPASAVDYSVSGGDDIVASSSNTSISVGER